MELDLHVTNNCNLQCAHCIYESNEKKMRDITLGDVKKIIPALKTMQVKEVHITGGEPLLNSFIYEIIDLLKSNEFIVRLQTNGMLITPSTINLLKKSGIDSVLVSLDGMEECHNYLRGNNNSFKFAINAIKLFSNANIYTRVNTVLHKKNIDDIRELIILLNEIGVDLHSFFYFTPGGRGAKKKELMLSLKEWKDAENTIKRVSKDLGCSEKIKIQNLLMDINQRKNECRIDKRDNCLLLSNGDVYPCVFFVNSEFCLGNIFNTDLLKIWNNSEMWLRYRQVLQKRCDSENCMGGCIGMTYLLKKTINICDPRCNKKENLIPGCIRRYMS